MSPLLSRDEILARATDLAKAEPLAELSMVRLAREFNVTPALIHYYVGSRDDLISGVVNRYFRSWVERVPRPTGHWRTDLERLAEANHDVALEYGGVLRYIVSHNRFRLFQKVAPGEIDYGVEFLDRFANAFRAGGFTPEQSALGYHLLAQYLVSSAYAQLGHQLPGEHEHYVYERLKGISSARYSGAHFIARPFSRLGAKRTFREGLRIMLDGFEGWLEGART